MSEGLVPFFRLFPAQAVAETRVITTHGHSDLPDDEYGILEAYCDDSTCDCRRVMLNVVARRQNTVLASISYGFDREDELAGPFLDPLNRQSRYADSLLALVSQVLVDPAYVARLRAHYDKVKGATRDPRLSRTPTAQRRTRKPRTPNVNRSGKGSGRRR
jgi:hypothetical protein